MSKQHDKICVPCPQSCGIEHPKDCKIVLRHNFIKQLKSKIEEELQKIIKRLIIDINIQTVTLKTNFINDLGIDSLDVVELTMAIEDFFNV
jgi:acyl carrier protein